MELQDASTPDLSSLTLNEQLRRGAVGRLFILFSQALDLFSRSIVRLFPTICSTKLMVGKILTICSTKLMMGKIPTEDLENRSSASEKSINSLPLAPHPQSSRASPTSNILLNSQNLTLSSTTPSTPPTLHLLQTPIHLGGGSKSTGFAVFQP